MGVILLCTTLYFLIFNKKEKEININSVINNYNNRIVKTSNKAKENFEKINDTNKASLKIEWEKKYKEMFGNVYNVAKSNKDFDGDGLSDEDEFSYGTNPYEIDTDYDNYWDGHEVSSGSDPLTNELKNLNLVKIGPNIAYSFNRIDVLKTLFPNNQEEFEKKDAVDQDFDGIPNIIEVYNIRTNGGFIDTDDDGLSDYYEILLGYNPLVNDFKFSNEQRAKDSDKDYIFDDLEKVLGTNSNKKDSDNDGLCDFWELRLFKNPIKKDFDKDYKKLIEDNLFYSQGKSVDDIKNCIYF